LGLFQTVLQMRWADALQVHQQVFETIAKEEQKLTMVENDALPLRGQRVLVTRTREQAGALSSRLRAVGADPIELPMIRIEDPVDWQTVDRALTLVHEGTWYNWAIFTSVNVVQQVFRRMETLGHARGDLNNVQIATVGPQTAMALERAGVNVTLVPGHYALTDVVDMFRVEAQARGDSLVGKKILLLRPVGGRPTVVEELVSSGAHVDEVAVHRALPCLPDDAQSQAVVKMLRRGELAAVTFTASSTVHHFVHWLQQAAPDIWQSLRDTDAPVLRPLMACIGPVTGDTVRSYGLPVGVEATEYTIEGLVKALEQTVPQNTLSGT
jgi:uroporphyrinogen III methyltransferase/synthase